jgi:hypothetical protein
MVSLAHSGEAEPDSNLLDRIVRLSLAGVSEQSPSSQSKRDRNTVEAEVEGHRRDVCLMHNTHCMCSAGAWTENGSLAQLQTVAHRDHNQHF